MEKKKGCGCIGWGFVVITIMFLIFIFLDTTTSTEQASKEVSFYKDEDVEYFYLMELEREYMRFGNYNDVCYVDEEIIPCDNINNLEDGIYEELIKELKIKE